MKPRTLMTVLALNLVFGTAWAQDEAGKTGEADISALDRKDMENKHEGTDPVIDIWDPEVEVPAISDLKVIPGIRYEVITEVAKTGGNWILGTHSIWHKGKLWTSFGWNYGEGWTENSATEQARLRVSTDLGKSWSKDVIIDDPEGELAASHGVFHLADGKLWAFHGAFYGKFTKTHMRAYLYDEENGTWLKKGKVLEHFWPMQEPVRMANGKWIMAGARLPRTRACFPGVAVCDGDDFTRWSVKVLPLSDSIKKSRHWGESTVIVDGRNILLISRWNQDKWGLASVSNDYGETWSEVKKSNLPMQPHKPHAGILSNGAKYLICSNARDVSGRWPITITLAKPGAEYFSEIMIIRNRTGKDYRDCGRISYPHAWEHEGHLYVTYACHKKWAELAVVPIDNLVKR